MESGCVACGQGLGVLAQYHVPGSCVPSDLRNGLRGGKSPNRDHYAVNAVSNGDENNITLAETVMTVQLMTWHGLDTNATAEPGQCGSESES